MNLGINSVFSPYYFKNQTNIKSFNALEMPDIVSFSGNKKEDEGFRLFLKEFQEAYESDISDVLYTIVFSGENKIGEGAQKIVSNIPGVDDFVVAKLKKKDPDREAPFVEYFNPFPKYNFSQPIGGNNADLEIMAKIDGVSYSLPDWGPKYRSVIYDGAKVSRDEALSFLYQIEEIEKFPLDSYVDLAGQIRYLTDRKLKIDDFSPNNILVDYKNKKFNLIDLMPDSTKFYNVKPEINGVQNMINILCDSLLHSRYFETLEDDEAQRLFGATKSVIRKCRIAGKIAGLSPDSNIARSAYDTLDKALLKGKGRNPKFLESYLRFEDLYKKELDINQN